MNGDRSSASLKNSRDGRRRRWPTASESDSKSVSQSVSQLLVSERVYG